ncbi:MAG TPA: baseplate J/gp47 family protein [Bryobacteraceae bacterium]|nr:baseplate J/gp47 family protein [Bryobacteraceae bacterium]
MPLPLPNLDTRTWQDLVDEGTALVPRYAPDWTDQNTHDPGITLMELFAWLAEMDIYRLNQVPRRHRLKFLELVGFVPRPPEPSRAMLTFSPVAGGPFAVPAGVQFETPAGVPFQTLRDVPVSVAPVEAIAVDDGSGVLRDMTADWLGGIPIACMGSGLQPGAAVYLGFGALPAGAALALGIRVSSCRNGEAERRRILDEVVAQEAACRATALANPCAGAPPSTPPGALAAASAAALRHHSARIVWEAFTGVWTALVPVSDDTRALTLDGIVELPVPAGVVPIAIGGVAKPYFYLRCRLASGSYDAAPLLLDVAPNTVYARQAVPAVTTFQIPAGVLASGTPPAPGGGARFDAQIDFAGNIQSLSFLPPGTAGHPDIALLGYQPATAAAPGALTLSMARAGYSDGTPNQRMLLPGAPVEQRSLSLYTHAGGVWQQWERREDLDASTRSSFHFVLDAASGEIAFGDGEHGMVPALGASVLAVYRQTLAERGNAPARAIGTVSVSPWNAALLSPALQTALAQIATNRAPAVDGAAQEDIDGAAGRPVAVLHAHELLVGLAELHQASTLDQVDPAAVRALAAPTRAVNLLDIERMALAVPGTCVARAHAWAAFDAAYPCLRAPGAVTVLIVPQAATPKPVPSAGLIAAVQRYLDLRRIVCTRIVVAAPQYLTVTVTARIALLRGASAAVVTQSVQQALNRFLDPRTGGPAGFGWPFGRDVYRSEILSVIQDVPGVDHVNSLSLASDQGAAAGGNISVRPTWLVTPGAHRIQTV